MPKPTVYIASDGKPGHLAQSRGLAAAIGRRIDVDCVELSDQPIQNHKEEPGVSRGLILAAGRGAHRLALSLKRQLRLPAVALMNPGWVGRKRFDWCVIPSHDGIMASPRVIITEGVLNTVMPAERPSMDQGLILMGGPSKHHGWDGGSVAQQVQLILGRGPLIRWSVTDSRRTPDATRSDLQQIAKQYDGRLSFCPASETPPGWVAEQLQRCGVCWVSEDSVSMVYEALTAGARAGLLAVPRKPGKPGRVVRGIQSLIDRGWVTTFEAWRDGEPLPADRPVLAEADRVAEAILERWPMLTD